MSQRLCAIHVHFGTGPNDPFETSGRTNELNLNLKRLWLKNRGNKLGLSASHYLIGDVLTEHFGLAFWTKSLIHSESVTREAAQQKRRNIQLRTEPKSTRVPNPTKPSSWETKGEGLFHINNETF